GPISPRAAGELRILCLGDSFTEGLQMDVARTYPMRLEALLREGAASDPRLPRARVFNGGRSGRSVAYTVGLAGAHLRMFDPDWVVVLVRNEWDALLFDRSEEFFYEPSPGGFELRRSWHWLTMSPLRRKLVDWKLRDVALIHFGTQHLMSL